jgi:hypothetical protein
MISSSPGPRDRPEDDVGRFAIVEGWHRTRGVAEDVVGRSANFLFGAMCYPPPTRTKLP